jgi:hypothetical protein
LGYAAAVAFILIMSLVGVAYGDIITTSSEYVYRADQSVTGNGFYSSYQNIAASNLYLNNRGYCSGNYSHESTLSALNAANNYSSGEFYSTNERSISFRETVDQVFGEANLNLERSCFKSGPLKILGKEDTCIKNYENDSTGVSMEALFDSASVLSKDLSADLYWKNVSSGYLNDPFEEGYSAEQKATTSLNVAATFTGGGHIGAMEINNGAHDRNNNTNVLIDEDYIGTFSISKKMSDKFGYLLTHDPDEWLPCCYGGWDSMRYFDQKGFGASTKGVFDCTCYQTHSTAQFTEPSEKKAW